MINYSKLQIRVMWSQLNKKRGMSVETRRKQKQKGQQIQITEKQRQSETCKL